MQDSNEPISRQQHRQNGIGAGAKWGLSALVLAAAGFAWWHYEQGREPAPVVSQSTLTPEPQQSEPDEAPAPVEQAPPALIPLEQVTDHPLKPAADEQGNPPLAADSADAGDVLEVAVSGWLGRESVLRFVALQGLAHKAVATVDNLPRSQAASRLWPLHPVGGRMVVTSTEDGPLQIAPENAERYDALVNFVTGVNSVQAASMYRRLYPVLQKTYEELGFPGKSFNNRLVAVIDHLLQTPEPDEPLKLKLVQVQAAEPGKAQAAPQQPWLRYEFADAKLQALSAGQKILLRMGVNHTRSIKAFLRELRVQIA